MSSRVFQSMSPLAALGLFASLCLGACGAPEDVALPDDEVESSRALGAPPVQLIHAQAGLEWGQDPHQLAGTLKGEIELEDLAYEKSVVVHYSVDGSPWVDAPAHFASSLGGGRERWRFFLKSEPGPVQIGNWQSFQFRFALRYEVKGQTFWDNRGGPGVDYQVSTAGVGQAQPDFAFGKGEVALVRASYGPGGFLRGEVATRTPPVGFEGGVWVVASGDGWRTQHWLQAGVMEAHADGRRKWSFGQALVPAPEAGRFELAVRFRSSGVDRWDNNFGRNYTLRPGLAIDPAIPND